MIRSAGLVALSHRRAVFHQGRRQKILARSLQVAVASFVDRPYGKCWIQHVYVTRTIGGARVGERVDLAELRAPHERCSDCPIRHRAVCSYSTPSLLSELDAAKFYKDFAPGQEIIGEGEPCESLGSVVEGVVALHRTLEDGRRQTVGLLFPADFVGRPLRRIAPYDAIAVTPVRMCMFHRKRFEDILSRNPVLERRLLEMTLDELDAARNWMLLLGRKNAIEKLASFLMTLAHRAAMLGGKEFEDGLAVSLPLTREAIAEYLGLTIETVSRQFGVLKRNSVIQLPDPRVTVIEDLRALMHLAGEDPDQEFSPADLHR